MAIINLLTFNAVPFIYPDEDKSIAARRYRSKQIKQRFQRPDMKMREHQHIMMTTAVVNEAVDTLHDVVMDAARLNNSSSPVAIRNVKMPDAPPNSPNNNPVTFVFPEVYVLNPADDSLPPVPSTSTSNFNEEEIETKAALPRATRFRRSQRKRRRAPSFKTKQTPRVPAKLTHNNSDEADDEDSEDDLEVKVVTSVCALRRVTLDNMGDSSSEEEEELKLKLNVLSEVQRSITSDKDRQSLRQTDWSKIGEELRHIADKFTDTADDIDGRSNNGNSDQDSNVVDLVSMANLMLPFSIPQSLWSALVSYAAWKIFKRFQ